MTEKIDEEEAFLKSMLVEIHREYQMRAQPYIDRLVAINAMRPTSPIIIEQSELPENVKQYFRERGMTE